MFFADSSFRPGRTALPRPEQVKLISQSGLWVTSAALHEQVLYPAVPEGDHFPLLTALSVNNTATLLAAGAFDTLLAFDPARPVAELPRVPPEVYLSWPAGAPAATHHLGNGTLWQVSLDEQCSAWADWLVGDEGRVVGLSLFGKPRQIGAIAGVLDRREPVLAAPATVQAEPLCLALDTEPYLQLQQSVALDLEHRLWVHPHALLRNVEQQGLRQSYLVGRQPLWKFARLLKAVEPVPFLPIWAPQLYQFALDRRYLRDLGQAVLRVQLPDAGHTSPFARFLVQALKQGRLPLPEGYDFLARTVAGKSYHLVAEEYDPQRHQTTQIACERFSAGTRLLYFDGTLVELRPGADGSTQAPAPASPPEQPERTPRWIERYERRPPKIGDVGEYIQTLRPQVRLPEPLWQGEDHCRDLTLARAPFHGQRDAINALVSRFAAGWRTAALIAQTGTGKSLMGVATAACLAKKEQKHRPFHIVVLAPAHLVQEDEQNSSQWREEIEAALPRDTSRRIVPVQSLATLGEYRRQWRTGAVSEELVFFLVTPHILRGSRQRYPAVLRRRVLGTATVWHLSDGTPRLPGPALPPVRSHLSPPWAQANLLTTLRRLWANNQRDKLAALTAISPRLCLEWLSAAPQFPSHSAIAQFIREKVSGSREGGFAKLWQARLALVRREVSLSQAAYCPRCFERILQPGEPLSAAADFCHCSEPLFSYAHQLADSPRRSQWPLPLWLKHSDLPIDLLLADEAHMYKARDTSQAGAFRALVCQARYTLAMTASPSDGYASSLHYLLHALSGRYRRDFKFSEAGRFARTYGLWQRSIVTDSDSGKKIVRLRERPGIHPNILKHYLLELGIPLLLSDLADLKMPPLLQYQHLVAMEPEQAERVHAFNSAIAQALEDGDWRLSAAALQKQLVCPDLCFAAEDLVLTDSNGTAIARFEPLAGLAAPDGSCLRLLPKEEAVFKLLLRQKALGRKTLIYVCHTGRYDYIDRFLGASDYFNRREGQNLRIAGFYATAPHHCRPYQPGEPLPPTNRQYVLDSAPHDRRRKLLAVLADTDAVIINSRCVETGLNLREFPTIVYLEVPFGATNFRQSGARSWRPGQTQPVEVHAFVYRDSFQLAALKLVGAKLAYDNRVRGELTMNGFEEDGIDGDLIHQLSQFIRGELKLENLHPSAFSDHGPLDTVQTLFRFEPVRSGRRKKTVTGLFQGVLF